MTDNAPDYEPLIHQAAKAVTKMARGYMDFDDLTQTGWLYVLEHPRKTREAHTRGDRYLFTVLKHHLMDTVRREKAARDGYEVEDQHRYSVKQLRKILPAVYTRDWTLQAQIYDKQPGGNGTVDPADAWVAVADVRRGLPRLSLRGQDLLRRVFDPARDQDAELDTLAREWRVTRADVHKRVHNELKRLARKIDQEG